MFKKLFNKLFSKNNIKTNETITKLNQVLYPDKGVSVVYEELTEYKIKGEIFKLGDKVICRSNECDPLMVGIIVEFWDNHGKWDNCIPQVKDDSNGKTWGVMGHIKHYSDELMYILKPMKPLEQWNYLIPEDLKKIYSYSQETMDKKQKLYDKLEKIKQKKLD